MQSEMESGSIRHVMSYLESILRQKSEQVSENLNRLKEVVFVWPNRANSAPMMGQFSTPIDPRSAIEGIFIVI